MKWSETTVEITVHYKDGSKSQFESDSVETVNDVAFVGGILQTNVADVEVSG